jgi:hypothetical protein
VWSSVSAAIQSPTYYERSATAFDDDVIRSYVIAARAVTMTTAFAAIVAVATVVVSRLADIALFRRLGIAPPPSSSRCPVVTSDSMTAAAAASSHASQYMRGSTTPPPPPSPCNFRFDGDDDRTAGSNNEDGSPRKYDMEFDDDCNCNDEDEDDAKSSNGGAAQRSKSKTGNSCSATMTSAASPTTVVALPLLGCRYTETKV